MESTVSILVGGDFRPDSRPENIQTWAQKLSFIKDFDIAMINLEGPFTQKSQPIHKLGPALKIDPDWANALLEAGIQVVSLANNHITDMGKAGLEDTFRFCDQSGLKYFGAGPNLREARKPFIFERKGIRVGFLAFAEHEFSIASKCHPGASPINPIENSYDICSLKKDVDYLIVILHAGNEHYPFPRPGLVDLCRFYVKMGANSVICHHSHVANGYEVFENAPIYYGTGNFFFPKKGESSDAWSKGYMVAMELGRANTISTTIIPCAFDQKGVYVLGGREKDNFLKGFKEKSEVISNSDQLEEEWEKFCAREEKYYVSTLLSYSKIDQLLFRWNIINPRIFKSRLLTLQNFIDCESHQELVVDVLKTLNSVDRQSTPRRRY